MFNVLFFLLGCFKGICKCFCGFFLECLFGYFGENCFINCLWGYYGNYCINRCECFDEFCNVMIGCVSEKGFILI